MIEFIVIIIGALAYIRVRVPIVRLLLAAAMLGYLGHWINGHHYPWGTYLVICVLPFLALRYAYHDRNPS